MLMVMGFTVISAKNYTENMAVVALTSTAPNSIREELIVQGGLYYSQTVNVVVPEGCFVEGVFVEKGDHIANGSPLIQLKEADLQIIYLQKQSQKKELLITHKNDDIEEKLAYWQLQVLEEELEFLKQLIDNKGIIYSTSDGYVISQEYKEGIQTTSSSYLELGLADGGCYLEWAVEPQDYRSYTGTAFIHGEEKRLEWTPPVFENGIYVYRTELPEITECIHGEWIQIQLSYVSEEYRAVIPKSCIWYDTDGATYVYEVSTRKRNFGEEFYVVKVGVTIEEQDEVNVAVKSPLTDIVLRSSKPLSDMEAVLVIEE